MGEIEMVEAASGKEAPLQFPARLQLQGHKPISLAAGDGPAGYHQGPGLDAGSGEQQQLAALLLQPHAVTGRQVHTACPQRIAVAVEVTATDSRVIKSIQAGIHQAISPG
jgi:hypothetical protein